MRSMLERVVVDDISYVRESNFKVGSFDLDVIESPFPPHSTLAAALFRSTSQTGKVASGTMNLETVAQIVSLVVYQPSVGVVGVV